MSGRSLRIFKADSHSFLMCSSKLAIRSHNRVNLASLADVLKDTNDFNRAKFTLHTNDRA